MSRPKIVGSMRDRASDSGVDSGHMCGIVGLFAKSTEIEEALGAHLAAMLAQMCDRGPDSAGVAVYRDPAPAGPSKLTLFSADPLQDWEALAAELANAFGGAPEASVRASHAVLVVDAERGRGRGLDPQDAPGPPRDERRPGDRDLQGDRAAPTSSSAGSASTSCAARTRSATRGWRPRAA